MEHPEEIIQSLVFLFVLGVTTQWIAWRIRIPAILLLLAVGSFVGSYLQLVQPQDIFQQLLLPIVSLSVGIILFEGGLNLRFVELKHTWRSLVGLLTVGVLVTWSLVTVTAITVLQLPVSVALLLGSILVVTGPTVIGPLIRDIRPAGKVGVIAKWEGIVIDPIGASLAVLVFNAIAPLTSGQVNDAVWNSVVGFTLTLLAGTVCGLLPAFILAQLMRRFLLPDYLQNPMTLMLVLTSFAAANYVQDEAGLLAVTIMGIALANYKNVDVTKIVQFKEGIATLLISTLFIILSARVPLNELYEIGWRGPLFAIVLILLVRPICVWLSTIGSGLTFAERSFLAWFAPRGIVAAAVTSVFALRMGESGEPMVPATFWVIFLTVAVYGLTAPFVARRLGLAAADAQGLLIAGANKTVREIALALQKMGFQVTMVDTQFPRIRRATQAGLNGSFANVLSEEVLDLVDFGGIGKFLAMTANDQVNTLAAVRFREMFGSSNVYQLKSNEVRPAYLETRWQNHIAGRTLFSADLTFEKLDSLIASGGKVYEVPSEYFIAQQNERASEQRKSKSLVSSENRDSTQAPEQALAVPIATNSDASEAIASAEPKPKLWPLFIADGKRLNVCTTDSKSLFKPNQKVIAISATQIDVSTLMASISAASKVAQ